MALKQLVAVSAALFLGQTGVSEAAVLDLWASGTCLEDCANVGLADGDGFGGSITVDDAFFVPDGYSGNAALVNYSFSFGSFVFTSSAPPDPAFVIAWGASPGSVAGFLIHAFVSDDPARPAPLLILDMLLGGSSFASQNGYEREIPGGLEIGFDDAAVLSVEQIAPVPVPAAGLLMLAAAAALFGMRSCRS